MRIVTAAMLGAVFLGTGCYHATIETGATPSAEFAEEQWAASWVYGLVPPKIMNTAAKCTSGVAKVETQHSFLNGLVAVLTFGIFTPINIKATCAAKRTARGADEPVIRVGVDVATVEEGMRLAVVRSRDEGRPIDVEY